jgi:hypothetical protein
VSIPPALLDAGQRLRDQAAHALGDASCSVLITGPGGHLVHCHPDGGITLVPLQGSAQVLRRGRGRGSVDVRTARPVGG